MWEVNGTKKGALPVKVEKRPKGKTVTILSNVYKEPQLLLTQLQRCLGAGGKLIGGGMIEVQGTHEKRLTQFLLDCPKQLKGIKGLSASTKKQAEAAEIAAAEAAAAESNAGSSRRTDKPRWERRDKEKEKTFAAEQSAREEHNLRTKGVRRLCPEDWPYCSGGCIDHHDELAAGLIKELPDNVLEADMNIISNLSLSSSTSSPMLSKLAVTDAAIDTALRAMGLLAEGYQEALKEGRSQPGGDYNGWSSPVTHKKFARPARRHNNPPTATYYKGPGSLPASSSWGGGGEGSATATSKKGGGGSKDPKKAGKIGKRGGAAGRSVINKRKQPVAKAGPSFNPDASPSDGYRDYASFGGDDGASSHASTYASFVPSASEFHHEHGDGAMSMAEEVQHLLHTNQWDARFGSLIDDVLGTRTAYCWEVFVVEWKKGISEEDAFLTALETSLDVQAGMIDDVDELVESGSDTGYGGGSGGGGGATAAVGGTSGYSGYYGGHGPTQDHGLRDGAMHSLYHDLDRRADAAAADALNLVQTEVGGVGDRIVSIDGESWGTVECDEGQCWRLESGRIANKKTKGIRWRWAPLHVTTPGGGSMPSDFWDDAVPDSVRRAQEEAAAAAVPESLRIAGFDEDSDSVDANDDAGTGSGTGAGAGMQHVGANGSNTCVEMPPPYVGAGASQGARTPSGATLSGGGMADGGFWMSGPSELAPDLDYWLKGGTAGVGGGDDSSHDIMSAPTVGERTEVEEVVAAAAAAAAIAADEFYVPAQTSVVEQESMVAMLQDLGFRTAIARRELVKSGWDVEVAIDQLLTAGDARDLEERRAKKQREEQRSKTSMAESGYTLQRRPKKGKGGGGGGGGGGAPQFYDELEQLLGMGFERSLAERALVATNGNVEIALMRLLS
eukprot:gene627-618_t